MTRSGGSRSASLSWGVALTIFGALLLLNNFDVLKLREVIRWMALSLRDLWPLAFVAMGAGMIAEGMRGRRRRQVGEPGAGS